QGGAGAPARSEAGCRATPVRPPRARARGRLDRGPGRRGDAPCGARVRRRLAARGDCGAARGGRVIGHGIPIYVALEPVDLRLGAERLGALVRERMHVEPRTRALFVFIGKRGHAMKVLTWDGTGMI